MRDETLNDRLRELGVFDTLVRVLEKTYPVLMCSCTSRVSPFNGPGVPHDRDCALLRLTAQFLSPESTRQEDSPENAAEFARWVETVLASRKARTWAEVEYAMAITQNRRPDIE